MRYEDSIAYQVREKLAAGYRKGVTQAALAERYGITRDSVRTALLRTMGPGEYSRCRLVNRTVANGGKPSPPVQDRKEPGVPGVLDVRHPAFVMRCCLSAGVKSLFVRGL